MADKKNALFDIANELIEQIKAGAAPWQKPWKAGELQAPYNPVSGTRYRAGNFVRLLSTGYTDPRWLTFKQAKSAGYKVAKGSRSTVIAYWQTSSQKTKTDEHGKPVLDQDGKPIKINITLERPRLFRANVFNASQIEGIPALERPAQKFADIDAAESLLNASAAVIVHDQRDRAFYNVGLDEIHLPPKAQFDEAAAYYATALHELGHWTGHSTRLDRDLSSSFGSEGYAREELRAEISSLMVAAELRLPHDPSQHASYVDEWVAVLNDDPNEIHRAARDAGKISQHILSLGQQQTVEKANGLQQQEGRSEGSADAMAWMDRRKITPMTHSEIREEFIKAAETLGLRIDNLKMDGQYHRCTVIRADGKKPHNQDGIYKVYTDGLPAGYLKNFYTNEDLKWKASRPVDPLKSAMSQAEMTARRQAAETRRALKCNHVAKRCQQYIALLDKASNNHPYLIKKGLDIKPDDKVYQDRKGHLILPLHNSEGEIRSFIRINAYGGKRIKKGSEKHGHFLTLGEPQSGEAVAICEGYSTAQTLRQATGQAVIVAVDAGNLAAVALAAEKAYSQAVLFVAGDDDAENDRNTGRIKAEEAAKAISSFAVFPTFEQGANKARSDFNDLARVHGREAVKTQVNTAVRRGRAQETLKQKHVNQREDRSTSRSDAVLDAFGRGR